MAKNTFNREISISTGFEILFIVLIKKMPLNKYLNYTIFMLFLHYLGV